MSGIKRFASITKPAVNDNHTVNSTGAVERYFRKLLSILIYDFFIFIIEERQ
jgi:hypothetical protein